MVEASRRAARDGIANAIFVVSSAEALPGELHGLADELVIQFPWGSLLRATTGDAPEQTARLACLVAPGGQVRMLIASSPRDVAYAAHLDPERVAAAWRVHGLQVVECRPATLGDASAAHSSWGKRLLRNPGPGRLAWQLALVRQEAGPWG